ncbi:XrtA/PEP-CTERM system exopolysaccharide export protein [Pleionea sp. CnH1-48]|uniref:XrtA/PEP-CTERM system exopolysaccharide export protein n=1 Tax=Pleionea sp. CnH1-48 TaxID=2954494 RepID=UPI00209800E3|nr:XrtA/PEP-CTERM system exopolysaccharide export protein [Pleionea sp. CnH1-48]MCO7226256.1 polysaccharide export protein [Pleionea sp. CnH1-48]
MLRKNLFCNALFLVTFLAFLSGCSGIPYLESARLKQPFTSSPDVYEYLIGPGDSLDVFVWRNPEVSAKVVVRPDGKITTPLVEDLNASNITPSQLARNIEKVLATYIKDPIVTITVRGFSGPLSEQIRVVGEAAKPRVLAYRQHLTLLDVMIAVGGLTEFADGNDARIFRVVNGVPREYKVRLDDLVRGGDIRANVELLPGDVLIIPEAWF